MAEAKRKSKTTRSAAEPVKTTPRSTAKRQESEEPAFGILAGTEPEDREQVIKRLIKGLKKA